MDLDLLAVSLGIATLGALGAFQCFPLIFERIMSRWERGMCAAVFIVWALATLYCIINLDLILN